MTLFAVTDTGARNIESFALWVAFLAGVAALLLFTCAWPSRRDHAQKFGEPVGWSMFWITISVGFGGYLWWRFGGERGLEFFPRVSAGEIAFRRQSVRLRHPLPVIAGARRARPVVLPRTLRPVQ